MPREPRSFDPEWIYHLTSHGVDDRPIFGDDTDRQSFALRLRRVALRWRWLIYAACLMDTHYHLVLQPRLGDVSDGMKALNGGHSRAYNERHGRRGALFESRYRDREIRDERHLEQAVRYVVGNPVTAGVVADPADWPWSTHPGSSLRELLAPCLAPGV